MSKAEISSDVLAIVVNYNAGRYLVACVNSLLRSRQSIRICVVDNASSDDSVVRLQNEIAEEQKPEIIINDENVGFARANNQVLRNRRAEFYALVNPDCEVGAETIGKILEVMRDDNTIGLASCLIKNADGSMQKTCRRKFPTPWSGFVRTFGLNALFPRVFKDFDYGDSALSKKIEYVEAISGAFMVVRGSALEEVGYLDSGYFMHCEDLDWCKRFWQAGLRVAFIPGTSVTHQKGVGGRSLRVNWHLHQGMLRFYKKFYLDEYPKIMYVFIYAGIALSFLAKSTLILLRGPKTRHG